MPTYLVGPTRPYTTIQAALSAVPSNLAGTGVHEIIVDAGLYTITSPLLLTSGRSNVSASDYIHLMGATGHLGDSNSGVRISYTGASVHSVIDAGQHSDVSDLVIQTSVSSVNGLSSGTGTNIITRVLARITGGGDGFQTSSIGRMTFISCLAYGGNVGFATGFSLSDVSAVCYNCGAFGFYNGFFGRRDPAGAGTASVAVNCWAYETGSGQCFGVGGFNTTLSKNNASNDSTAPGSNSRTSLTLSQFAFVSVSGGDFHISQHSVLYNAGADLSSVFNTDIDNQTITLWSIGPDSQASTNNCQTDIFGYSIGSSSSPWKLAFISFSPTNSGSLLLWDADLMLRDAYNTSGGYVTSFTVNQYLSSFGRLFFGPSRATNPFSGGYNTPGLAISSTSVTLLGGNGYSVAAPAGSYGAWNGQNIAISSGQSLAVTLYYRSGFFAASVTISGTTYSTGFVAIQSGDLPYSLIFISATSSSHFCYTGTHTYRLGLTTDEVNAIYNGTMAMCGSAAPVPSTAANPWVDRNPPHKTVKDASAPALKVQYGDRLTDSRKATKAKDAKAPGLKTQYGEKLGAESKLSKAPEAKGIPEFGRTKFIDGYVSIFAETAGYNSTGTDVFTGFKMPIIDESLGLNKSFYEADVLGKTKNSVRRTGKPVKPGGAFRTAFNSDDAIPLFMSHYQLRHGSLLSGATTYYEFYPAKAGVTLGGNSFGTGTYGASSQAFTLSAYKELNGTGQRFYNGYVDSLAVDVNAGGQAEIEAGFTWRRANHNGTHNGAPVGYSNKPGFKSSVCTVSFLGLDIIGFGLHSQNNSTSKQHLGGTYMSHPFGRHRVTGSVVVDYPKTLMAYLGSMLASVPVVISGTFQNSNADAVTFTMPRCLINYFDVSMNESGVVIPFEAYESETGTTPAITWKFWTTNYSATSFEPN